VNEPPPPHLSVVIPAYNEERRLPPTLDTLCSHLERAGIRYEVIVVDDGSADATAATLERAARRHPHLRVIRAPHRGKGHAVRTGMLAARGDFVLFSDADLSVSVEQMVTFPAALDDRVQVAIASREGPRARRHGEPAYRHLMGRVFNLVVQALAVPGVQDTQCGLKCFSRDSAQAIFRRLTIDGFGFDVEALFVARRLGYRVREVPVEWRSVPQSRVDPLRDTLRMFGDVLRVRLNAWRGVYGRPQRRLDAPRTCEIPARRPEA
jgi:glycosyltransferase involved in cell wall biosynthesis